MYCAKCGSLAQTGWKFCEKCGAPLEVAPAAASQVRTVPPIQRGSEAAPASTSKPKVSMSKKTKLWAGTIAGVAVLLVATFLMLRMTYGPSSPDSLAEKLNAAIDSKDSAAFAGYLSDPESPLLGQDRMQAFQTSLEAEDTRTFYKQSILNAIELASVEAPAQSDKETFSDQLRKELEGPNADLPASVMTFVEDRSWRGSKWSVRIAPVSLTAVSTDPTSDVDTSLQVGELHGNEQAAIENMWPGIYDYSGALTSEYGSQPFEGNFQAFEYAEPNMILFEASMMNKVALEFPAFEATVTLNGNPITGTPGEYVTFRPVPQQLDLKIAANVYGVDLSGETTIDVTEHPEYVLSELIRQEAAEKVADLAYSTMNDWVKATNTGDRKMLTGFDPNGGFGDYLTWSLDNQSDTRYALKKIIVNPVNIRFDQSDLNVNVAYEFSDSDNPERVTQEVHQLAIAQNTEKNGWWISNYAWGYIPDTDTNIERLNPEFDTERAALSKSIAVDSPSITNSTIASGNDKMQASASGSVAFAQDDIQAFMLSYLSSSVTAINGREFAQVANLMDPAGPAAQESADYIEYLDSKGITESFEDASVTGFEDNGDSTYTVNTRESYIIFNKDEEATAKSFNSVYKLSVIDGQLKTHTLISTKEIK
ncbi:TcaA NTF2-like domain-containing protein [Saccharibacillus sacchari]|uniref:Uncharacterized protein n=1 Tax=Saccharibacillus sacchari TaxID=456493 RepID=A0ACC6P9K7_9BACL